jgi:hypothetical protein
MYLARLTQGSKPQVYVLTGCLYFPRTWRFVSYQRGAAAIGETAVLAVKMAKRELQRLGRSVV